MIRVFVTDDHELLRVGIKKVLNEEVGMIVGGEASTAAETLDKVRHDQFDVVVTEQLVYGESLGNPVLFGDGPGAFKV